MSSARRQPEPVTIEAFVAFVAFVEMQQDDACLYELVEGVIVMMSNPTESLGRQKNATASTRPNRTSSSVAGLPSALVREHYRRTENGFELEVLKKAADHLEFQAVGFSLDLASVYFRVEA